MNCTIAMHQGRPLKFTEPPAIGGWIAFIAGGWVHCMGFAMRPWGAADPRYATLDPSTGVAGLMPSDAPLPKSRIPAPGSYAAQQRPGCYTFGQRTPSLARNS